MGKIWITHVTAIEKEAKEQRRNNIEINSSFLFYFCLSDAHVYFPFVRWMLFELIYAPHYCIELMVHREKETTEDDGDNERQQQIY